MMADTSPPYNPAYVPIGPANRDNAYAMKINQVRLAKCDESKSEYMGTVGCGPGSPGGGVTFDQTDVLFDSTQHTWDGGIVAGGSADYDKYWPSVMYAFAGLSAGDAWNSSTNPAVADVSALLTGSANENSDKAGIVWSTTNTGPPRRVYIGAFDGASGNFTQPNTSNSIVNGGTLTPTDGDWTTVGATGTFNFDGSAGGAVKTQGEWYLRESGAWVVKTACPAFDLPASASFWGATDQNISGVKNAVSDYANSGGHGLHYAGYWHKGGIFWFHHSLWNLTSEASILAFIAKYMHWNMSAVKAHFESISTKILNADILNETNDEDLTTSTANKLPGLRGWARTFPAYGIEEVSLHYAATLCPSLGADNYERIYKMHQYVIQTFDKYFPNIRGGINDFGWEGRRYTTNTMQSSTLDVNGNTANKTVWVGHQQGQKQIAFEYNIYRVMALPQVPIIFDAVLDAGAVYAPLRAMGMQLHLEQKNQTKIDALKFIWSRASNLNGGDFEAYISEANARADHLITNQVAAILTITGGVPGDTITSVKACFPTTQTVTGDELLAGVVNWTTDNNNTAALVAASINLGTGTHLYTALASTNTVRIRRDSAPRGFDLTSAKTGTVTLANVNSRVNEPTNVTPMFRQYYRTTLVTNQNTKWEFGWSNSNKTWWNYAAWVLESIHRTYLKYSRGRILKFWTCAAASGNFVSLWDINFAKTDIYDMVGRLKVSPDWIKPSLRNLINMGRIDFTWYKHLILTQSGVVVDINGLGTVISGTAGQNSHPWDWWTKQGISANNFGAVLSWTAPSQFPTSGTVLFSLFLDANNIVRLTFTGVTGELALQVIVAGATVYTANLGSIINNVNNVVAFTVTPTGGSGSLNAAAVVNRVGAPPVGTTLNIGFSHANLVGYANAKILVLDVYDAADIGDLVTASVVPALTNPWPLWDGSGSQPPLQLT